MTRRERIIRTLKRPRKNVRCTDCGKPLCLFEEYIVRGEIWLEAGMGCWDSGFLHQSCLEARLGRKLKEDDFLLRYVGSIDDQ